MSACPICGKPVDALRARNVKVRGIQVVAYCSPECLAQAGDSMAVAAPVKPAAVPESGPVIEIRYEPASGVVASAKPEPKPEPKKPEPSKKDKKKGQGGKPGEVTPKPVAVEAKPADVVPAKPAEAKPEPKPAEPKPVDDKPVFKIIEEAGGTPRSVTPPKGAPIPPAAKVSPAKLSEAQAKLEPGKRRLTRDTVKRDSSNVDQAEDWLDDEPANVPAARAGTDLPAPGGGTRRALMILLVLALVGGGVVVAVKVLGSRDTMKSGPGSAGSAGSGTPPPSGGSSATTPGSGSAPPRVVGPARPVEAKPLERATQVLRHWLVAEDSTPRVQRLAAAALSRTGDKDAIERLAVALQKDVLEDAGRHDVAYALARAKDKRGVDAMTAAIAAPRRDDKLTVGRLLVQLGDTRAVAVLTPYLELPQHRIGAAEWLVRLGEPHAIKAMEQVRADDKASPDDKIRAALALTLAGKSGFSDELHALLKDSRWNWFAAEALASKRDDAARPVLVKLLEVTSLRVGAARSLRLLAPERSYDAELALLLGALELPDKQRDTEQVSIAEAILLLAGPPAWVEHQ